MNPTRKDEDGALQRLLAGGGLSGAQREEILEGVLRASAEPRPRRWFAWFAVGLVPAAAVGALLLVVGSVKDGAGRDRVVAKGGHGAILQARCAEREPGRCRTGDRVLFEVDGAPDGGLFAAYAEHPSGERVWYFPTADGRLPPVRKSVNHEIVGEGIRLGAEHAPGKYTLHLFVLDPATTLSVSTPELRSALADRKVKTRASALVPIEVVP